MSKMKRRLVSRRKKRTARSDVVTVPTPKELSKSLSETAIGFTEGSSDRAASERRIRPSHWRYLRGKMAYLEAGLPTTTVNHAKYCGVSRVALWKLQRRYPWLDEWCSEVMRDANVHYWGVIERRMAILAAQGSVQHADMYCKMQSGYYTRRTADSGEGDTSGGPVQVNQVYLVPRPEYPQLPPQPSTPPPLTVKDIPTLALR